MPGMGRARRLAWTLALLGLSGCGQLGLWHQHPNDRGPLGSSGPPPSALPEVRPRPTALDLLGRLPDPGSLAKNLDRARTRPGPYRALDAETCVRLAAANSSLGNMLDQKANELCPAPRRPPGHHRNDDDDEEEAAVKADVLRTAALEARMRSAADALTSFDRLAGAEAKLDLMLGAERARGTIDLIAGLDAERRRLTAAGLTIPVEFESMARQGHDLLGGRVELGRVIDESSVTLRDRLNLDPPDGTWRIWPVVDLLAIATRPIDPDLAVTLGLARNPELALLGRLDGIESSGTFGSLKAILARADPLLGLEPRKGRSGHLAGLGALLHPGEVDEAQAAAYRRQLRSYRETRARAIALEIRTAAIGVNAAAGQIGVARGRLTSAVADVARAADRPELLAGSVATFLARAAAELRVLEARNTLLDRLTDWHLAVVRLRLAQSTILD